MKKVHSLPVAWCSELKKKVTPEDMLQYRTQHPDQKLSLVCPECKLPLIFQPWIQGIVAQGYFKKPAFLELTFTIQLTWSLTSLDIASIGKAQPGQVKMV